MALTPEQIARLDEISTQLAQIANDITAIRAAAGLGNRVANGDSHQPCRPPLHESIAAVS